MYVLPDGSRSGNLIQQGSPLVLRQQVKAMVSRYYGVHRTGQDKYKCGYGYRYRYNDTREREGKEHGNGREGRQKQSPNRSAGFLVGIRESLFPTVTQYWGHYERRPRDSGEWEWAPLDVLNYRLSQSGWNQGPSSCLAQSAGDSARRSNTSGAPRAMPALYPPCPLCFLLPFVLPFF